MKKGLITFTLAALLFAFAVTPVLATTTLDPGINYGTYTGLGTKDIREGVMAVVNVLLGFLGVIAIIIVLYGGFTWMTAAGNEEKVAQAKKIITAGIIGLVIIFISFAIANFVISQIGEASGASGF